MNVVIPILIPSEPLDPQIVEIFLTLILVSISLMGWVEFACLLIRGSIRMVRKFIAWLRSRENVKGCLYEEAAECTADEGHYR